MHRISRVSVAAVIVMLAAPTERAFADSGAVRLIEQQGAYRVTVFTSPNPMRAGPVDVSVLLQDAQTEEALTQAQVAVSLTPRESGNHTIHALARNEAATNKLLLEARTELPNPGWWDVRVTCTSDKGPASVSFSMEVGPPLPAWRTLWPWFTWPAVIVLLFTIHRHLVRRQEQIFRKRRVHVPRRVV